MYIKRNITAAKSSPKSAASIAEAENLLDRFKLSYSPYRFPKEKEVPAGFYLAETMEVEAITNRKGVACLDVCYEIWGAKPEQNYLIRLRYPEKSLALQKLHESLGEAGLPNGAPITDAIGILEKIHLVYDYDTGYANILDRVPYIEPEEEDAEDDADDED